MLYFRSLCCLATAKLENFREAGGRLKVTFIGCATNRDMLLLATLRYVVPSRNANNFALEQGIIANLTLLISLQHPLQLKYTIILYAPSKMTSTQCIRVKIATGEKNRWRDRLCNALFWVLYVTFQVGQFSNLQLGQMKNCQASLGWPNFWN